MIRRDSVKYLVAPLLSAAILAIAAGAAVTGQWSSHPHLALADPPEDLSLGFFDPAFHTRILNDSSSLAVDGCTGETITLTTQMLRVVYAKLGLSSAAMGGIHPCPLHEVTP
jgi:hypothetical protein